MKRALHLLSQRPSLTGSGVTLDALTRHAASAGWDQQAAVGTSPDDPRPPVGPLSRDRIHPLVFESQELPFPVPGMSDVMPYTSTRFSTLDPPSVEAYVRAWKDHISDILNRFSPDVIHAHHVWLMSSIIKDIAPDIRVVNHCHATGLRQMSLCPHLRDRVIEGCGRNDLFCVLHDGHREALISALGVDPSRVEIVGAGYREDLFRPSSDRVRDPGSIVYVGKYSLAKGLPFLLDAMERLRGRSPSPVLHVAGDGSGPEAEELRERMSGMGPTVRMHGQLDQAGLAELMRTCSICVLPSFFEGLPLVLVEAMACGCRVVATKLPGIVSGLLPALEDHMTLVPLPRLIGPDTPAPEDIPAFVNALESALNETLDLPPLETDPQDYTSKFKPFTWSAVFARVERLWAGLP